MFFKKDKCPFYIAENEEGGIVFSLKNGCFFLLNDIGIEILKYIEKQENFSLADVSVFFDNKMEIDVLKKFLNLLVDYEIIKEEVE